MTASGPRAQAPGHRIMPASEPAGQSRESHGSAEGALEHRETTESEADHGPSRDGLQRPVLHPADAAQHIAKERASIADWLEYSGVGSSREDNERIADAVRTGSYLRSYNAG